MNQIVINTLVYLNELQNGVEQSELIARVPKLDVNGAEIRREFIKDFNRELVDIRSVADKNNMVLFYSVPDEVFVDGEVNPRLRQYLEEGQKMGIYAIKFNIGDFANFHGNLEKTLKFLDESPIEVNIENDQTQISGRIEPIADFLEAIRAANLDIKYVYDLGNWRFVGQDEFDAIEKLGKSTRYIHLKDVLYDDHGEPQVVPLDDGSVDWRKALEMLPYELPIAIEYPVENDEVLAKGVALVKAETAEG